MGRVRQTDFECPNCGSTDTRSRGLQFMCVDCKENDRSPWWFNKTKLGITPGSLQDDTSQKFDVTLEPNRQRIIAAGPEIFSQGDLVKRFKVDLRYWMPTKWHVRTSQGYRKDREVKWDVKDGVVTDGRVRDTGKMLIVTLYHHELVLEKRKAVVEASQVIGDLKKDMEKFAPKYPKIRYPKIAGGVLAELDFPDLHLGKLAWADESGSDYDIKIARQTVRNAMAKLLSYTRMFKVSKILFPLGNDFFNVNSMLNETVHGTPQSEDTRWQKTFLFGRRLVTEMIDLMVQIAPVDVLIIPGNHDEERLFYLGDSIASWYRSTPNVDVDNHAKKRKYYRFGQTMLGFTHGYYEKVDKLPTIMPMEEPLMWAASKYREWHIGDKHHLKTLEFKVDEGSGMPIRYLRSLSATDTWHFDKGFVGSLQAAQMFIWHPDGYMMAEFTAGGLASQEEAHAKS